MNALSRCLSAFMVGLAMITMNPAALGVPPSTAQVTQESVATTALWREHYAPRSAALKQAAERLAKAAQAQCAGSGSREATQTAWRQVLQSWVPLMTVDGGPMRQSLLLRRLDGPAMVPELIIRAMRREREMAGASETVGPASSGLGALEWMLWAPEREFDGAPVCPYLQALSQRWLREVQRNDEALKARVQAKVDKDQVHAEFEEFVSQWLSGLEKLRIGRMERPAMVERQRPPTSPWPRHLSNSTVQDRQWRWDALMATAQGPAKYTIQSALLARGQTALAARWAQEVQRCDTAMKLAQAPVGFEPATQCLGKLAQMLGTEVVTGLNVQLGFNDGDGN